MTNTGMKTTLVLGALLALLVLAGCTAKQAMAPAPTATDDSVEAVGSAVADLDSLTEDLDTADLNSLDQELADIENLELQ